MSKARDASCLPLVGDGDEEDLLTQIEESFGLKFGEGELADVDTVGQLHERLLRNLSGTVSGPRTHCRSAAAFRRLRHAFKRVSGSDVRPSTAIAALIDRHRQGHIIRELERHSGLSLDALSLPRGAIFASLAVAVFLSISWIALWPPHDDGIANALVAILAIVPGGVFLLLSFALATGDRFKRFGDVTVTVGDLAERASHLNFAKLTGRDEQNHPDDVWRTLTWLCREATAHVGEINHDTRLIS
ncbi:MAG: hypothetical protein SGI91_15000 [Alphaproteobacteria bacterium]|jgi:hypothetical protein|nr:hypothetical protein [Alphaproteobacteria bacterium]